MFTKNALPEFYFGEFDKANPKESKITKDPTQKISSSEAVNTTTEEAVSHFAKQESNILNISDIHSEPNLSRVVSPTSSITSNKKLEWDSGADIGYNIYDSLKHSRKSKSYPLLTVDFSSHEAKKLYELPVDVRGNEKVTDKDETDDISNISTNFVSCVVDMDKNKKLKKRNFQHSTPIENKPSTSRIRDPVHLFSRGDNSAAHSRSDLRDECLQTTLIRQTDQYIQTEQAPAKISDHKRTKKSKGTESASTSSDSNSFQYISGQELEKSHSVVHAEDSEDCVSVHIKRNRPNDEKVKLKINVNCERVQSNRNDATESKTSNTTTRSGSTTTSCTEKSHTSNSTDQSTSSASRKSEESRSKSDTSDNIPLAEIISTQHSNNLIEDIDRSLYYLQKFIKSRHYNPFTKEYYAKKIVTKIIQSKYSDDTSSSESVSEYSSRSNSPGHSNVGRSSKTATEKKKHSEISGSSNITESKSKSEKIIDTIFVRGERKRPSSSTENVLHTREKKLIDVATQYDEHNKVDKIIQSSRFVELVDKSTSYDTHLPAYETPVGSGEKPFTKSYQHPAEVKESDEVVRAVKGESNENVPTLAEESSENMRTLGGEESSENVPALGAELTENLPIDGGESNEHVRTVGGQFNGNVSTIRRESSEGVHTDTAVSSREMIDSSNTIVSRGKLTSVVRKPSPDSSEARSYRNWKEEKTISECLYEAKKMYYTLKKVSKHNLQISEEQDANRETRLDVDPSNNYLLQYSKREKRRQLSWINNEIECLRKLKSLLQAKDYASESPTCTSAFTSKDHSWKTELACNQSKNSSKISSRTQNSVSNNDSTVNSSDSQLNLENRASTSTTGPSEAISEAGLEKLSKYFTNEQLKNIIKYNTTDKNCSCLCCRYRSKLSKYESIRKSKDVDGKQDLDQENRNDGTEPQIISKADRSCQVSNTSTILTKREDDGVKLDPNIVKSSTSETRDVDIQCTIRRHKDLRKDATDTLESTIKSSETTDYSERGQSDCLIFENLKNFNSSKTMVTSTTVSSDFSYMRKQPSVSSAYSTSDKENQKNSSNKAARSHPHLQKRAICGDATKPVAYVLTFEEVSVEENGARQNMKTGTLEKVTVKVPKLKPKRDKQTTNKSNSRLTLQEYLCKNRPDFVQAAEFRRKCVADTRDCHNVFTCKEMKKITLKQYKKLPEVKDRVRQEKIENERRNNRLQANIFKVAKENATRTDLIVDLYKSYVSTLKI